MELTSDEIKEAVGAMIYAYWQMRRDRGAAEQRDDVAGAAICAERAVILKTIITKLVDELARLEKEAA